MIGVRCEAYQASDQMLCGRCGLVWDVNDPDPPPCPKQQDVKNEKDTGADHE